MAVGRSRAVSYEWRSSRAIGAERKELTVLIARQNGRPSARHATPPVPIFSASAFPLLRPILKDARRLVPEFGGCPSSLASPSTRLPHWTMAETSSVVKDQPPPIAEPSVAPESSPRPATSWTWHDRLEHARHKVTSKEGWLGDYNCEYLTFCVVLSQPTHSRSDAWLCTPSLPFSRRQRSPPPFYALHAELPLLLAITTGFQHSLAMLAGLITPPIIFASALGLDASTSAYMISASLIGCGRTLNPPSDAEG
jgi:hypothetical protein